MSWAGVTALPPRLDRLGLPAALLRPCEAVHSVIGLGAPEVDGCFRAGGLETGTHQAAGEGAAVLGFACALLARLQGARPDAHVLLVQEADAIREHGGLYAPGLKALGADPDRLALVGAASGEIALKVADEGVRSGVFAAVVLELRRGEGLLDLTLTRRFNMAAQRSGGLVLLLTPGLDQTSAALSRWRVASAPSHGPAYGPASRLLGRPALNLELLRNRAGPTGAFSLEWDHDACAFRPASTAGSMRAPVPARSSPLPAPMAAPAAGGGGAAEPWSVRGNGGSGGGGQDRQRPAAGLGRRAG